MIQAILILSFGFLGNAWADTPWDTLVSLHPASSKPTQKIKELISKPVELTGYTIIDESKDGKITEFLFTQKPGNCIHDSLPSPNHVVFVKLINGKSIPAYFNQKISIRGTLSMSSRGESAYELVADSFTQL